MSDFKLWLESSTPHHQRRSLQRGRWHRQKDKNHSPSAKNPVGTWYFTSAHNCYTILIINHLSRTRSIASLPCKIVREIDANSNVSTHWKHSKRTVHLVWFNLHLNLKRNHFIIEGGAVVFIVGAYMITNVSHSIKPGDVETESAALPQLPKY